MTAFPAPIYGRYRACTADNADIRLAGTHFAYADLYCESRSAAVPPHSSKSPLAVTRVSTAHHAQLCQTSASNEFRCCGPHTSLWREHAAAEYRGAGPTAHRHWRPRCGHSPPVCGPMPFPVRDKDGFLSSDSDLPPAYETLPAYSPPQNPTIATLTINGDVITTSLPQMFRHPHCVTRSPSLASGYLPDDVSDGNGSDCTFTGCAQGSSRLTDTSVRSLFGSSSLSETRTNFSESSQENLNLSDLKTVSCRVVIVLKYYSFVSQFCHFLKFGLGFLSLRHFGHFFRWDILVVCPMAASKLTVTLYIFRHCDRIFFGH